MKVYMNKKILETLQALLVVLDVSVLFLSSFLSFPSRWWAFAQ